MVRFAVIPEYKSDINGHWERAISPEKFRIGEGLKGNMTLEGPSTAEARFPFQATPFGICGGQSGTEKRFSPSTCVFRFSIIP